MNDDDPLSDLEGRLRAWRPAALPAELRTRLRAACPPPRRDNRWLRPALAAACALAVGAMLLPGGHLAPSPEKGKSSAATVLPGPQSARDPGTTLEPHWVLGESLTMNIYTGVPSGMVPAALRLDGESVASSGLFPVRSIDAKLTLKVDCQF